MSTTVNGGKNTSALSSLRLTKTREVGGECAVSFCAAYRSALNLAHSLLQGLKNLS